jgi:diguanylate cyclase (GGDEF)-like protein
VGFDSDWVDAGTKRVVDYTNLPHGRYRFQVRAANDDGVWNETGASVELEIEPRLHETLWFRALALAFFALAGPLFYFVRVRRLGRQKAELERQVAARTAELEAATERLAQLSREDALTGVANRRRLDEALEDEWRRASRQRSPLALLLLDVDFFKAYNDHLGHLAGDSCLKAVASTVADTHRRAGEVVARFGGEEFAVLLPGVPQEQARAAAEDLRQRVQQLDLPHPGSSVAAVVTVSVGVAWLQPEGEGSPRELLVAADRALYRAKAAGRNRVEGEL